MGMAGESGQTPHPPRGMAVASHVRAAPLSGQGVNLSLTFCGMANEVELAAILCSLIMGGDAEVRHDYVAAGRDHHVRVDCETDSHVIEVGFDAKRSTMDSLHQALFSAELTGKLPMIVVIDTNGMEESIEYQVRSVAQAAGVSYLAVDEAFLIRWQMTVPFRQRRRALLGDVMPVLN